MRIPVPASLADHVGRDEQPAVPKPAATVVLTRDGDDGIEAYLMRRQQSMAFAPGAYVFPGGGVDADDLALDVPWVGPGPDVWAERFSSDTTSAKGLVCAAVRETFEESGVLLAGPDSTTVVDDTSTGKFLEARRAMEANQLSLSAFLSEADLVLRADLLGAWAHWITPSFEPRRFDTHFFVATLPAGQRVGEMSSESDHAHWKPLRQVMADVEAGSASMLPPTMVTCRELADYEASGIMAAAESRSIHTIEPQLVQIDGEWFLESNLEAP